MFRFKRSVPLSYEQQGYIYFLSLLYKQLPLKKQKAITELCYTAGGEHHQALFEFVTTDAGAEAVCARHFLSRSTLERAVRRYYIAFSERFDVV